MQTSQVPSVIKTYMEDKQNGQAHRNRLIIRHSPYEPVRQLQEINPHVVQLIQLLANSHSLPFTPPFETVFSKIKDNI